MLTILLFIFMSLSQIQFDADSTRYDISSDSTQVRQVSLCEQDSVESNITLSPGDLTVWQPELVYPKVENNAFHSGEKLTFKVRYGFVRAGTATMSVLG